MKKILKGTLLVLCLTLLPLRLSAQILMSGTFAFERVGTLVTYGVERIDNYRPGVSGTLAIQLWATAHPYSGGTLIGYKLTETSIGTLPGGYYFDNIVRTQIFLEPPAGNYNIVFVLAEWNGFAYVTVHHGNFYRREIFGPTFFAPSILGQPQSLTVIAGQPASLTVYAGGTSPLFYQWRRNGAIISGATSASYTIFNVQPTQAGDYTVVVSNAGGAVASAIAVLTVNVPPSITAQPQSRTVAAGSAMTFSVAATGTAPLSYQWYFNGSPLSGATASSYSLSSAQTGDAGNYKVRVSNAAGSLDSSIATLTVQYPPTIMGENLVINGSFETPFLTLGANHLVPASEVIPWQTTDNSFEIWAPNLTGELAFDGRQHIEILSHSANATVSQILQTEPGQDYRLSFYHSPRPGVVSTLTVAIDSQLIATIPENGSLLSAFKWQRFQTDFTASSNFTTIKFSDISAAGSGTHIDNVQVISTGQPASRIVSAGRSVTFAVRISGTAPFTYQWYRNNSLIPGATSESYVINSVKPGDAGNFNVRVRNAVGAVDSATATLTVNISPSITAQPQSKVITAGNNVTFSVVGKGTLPLSYQWYRNNTAISDATVVSHSLSGAQASDAGDYKVRVSNTAGFTDSAIATLTVKGDTAKPVVVISSPAAGRLTDPGLTLTGTVRDNVRAVTVEYRLENSQGIGTYKPATGTSNWSATIASLIPGPNTVRVRASDAAGNGSAEVTRSFIYVLLSPLTLTTSGLGTVTPNLDGQRLEVGKSYTLTAMPAPGHVLSNWTGGLAGNSVKLSFAMQSNLTLQANFVTNPFIALRGSYNGLFYETNGVRLESSGFFNFALTDRANYSGYLQMNTGRLPFSGRFDLDGQATNIVKLPGQTNGFSLELTLDLSRTMTDRLTGRVVSANNGWTAELLADRAPVYAPTNGSPYLGKYTLMIPGNPGSGEIPGGCGIGTLTVAKTGRLSWSATLGDGKLVTQSVPVSDGGYWPLFVTPYKAKGSLLGWVSFDTNHLGDLKTNLVSLIPTGNLAVASLALGGNLSWIKLNQPDKYYPKGFTNEALVFGSAYSLQTPILQSGDWQLHFSGGNLSTDYVNNVFLTPNNKLTNAPMSQPPLVLQFNLASGTFSGNAKLPDSSLKGPLNFKGVVLRGLKLGVGQFFGTNQSAQVTLLPGNISE